MSRLKATSSAVAALWCGSGAGPERARWRQLDLLTRRTTGADPRGALMAYSARITARLQYTSTIHSTVPAPKPQHVKHYNFPSSQLPYNNLCARSIGASSSSSSMPVTLFTAIITTFTYSYGHIQNFVNYVYLQSTQKEYVWLKHSLFILAVSKWSRALFY